MDMDAQPLVSGSGLGEQEGWKTRRCRVRLRPRGVLCREGSLLFSPFIDAAALQRLWQSDTPRDGHQLGHQPAQHHPGNTPGTLGTPGTGPGTGHRPPGSLSRETMAACTPSHGHEGRAAGCRSRRMRPAPAERTTAAGSPVNSTDRKLQWNAPATGSRKGEDGQPMKPARMRAPWLSESGNRGCSCFSDLTEQRNIKQTTLLSSTHPSPSQEERTLAQGPVEFHVQSPAADSSGSPGCSVPHATCVQCETGQRSSLLPAKTLALLHQFSHFSFSIHSPSVSLQGFHHDDACPQPATRRATVSTTSPHA